MKSLVGMAFFLLIGCNSAQKNSDVEVKSKPQSQGGGQFERTISVKVEGFAKGAVDKKTFYFYKEQGEAQSLKLIPQYQMISRALGEDGFIEVEKESQAQYVIEVFFAMDKPFTGTAIFGNITPYTHKITLKAKQNKQPHWEITLAGPSEYDDRMVVMPVLLAAGIGMYGKTTSGVKEIRIQNSDPKVKKLRGD